MLIVGDKEEEEGKVAVRSRKEGDKGAVTLDKFMADLLNEIKTRAH